MTQLTEETTFNWPVTRPKKTMFYMVRRLLKTRRAARKTFQQLEMAFEAKQRANRREHYIKKTAKQQAEFRKKIEECRLMVGL
jgi:hypothetical protein